MQNGDRFLDLADARIRWRLEGTGPALVLLHGWALDLGFWDSVAPLLAEQFSVLRFDRRGFGLSEGLPDIHRNVDDLQAVLDAAGIDRSAVLGMSQGARLAIHFALHHPARVTALLLDGAPALEAESELSLSQYRRRLETTGLASLQAELLQHPLMRLQTTDPEAQRTLQAVIARYRGLDLLHHVARARAPDLRRIDTPTLVINGSLDSDARRTAGRQLQRIIPHARRIELPGAGHLAVLDTPAAYADAVRHYCGNLPALAQ